MMCDFDYRTLYIEKLIHYSKADCLPFQVVFKGIVIATKDQKSFWGGGRCQQ